jgi:hypothetical protein
MSNFCTIIREDSAHYQMFALSLAVSLLAAGYALLLRERLSFRQRSMLRIPIHFIAGCYPFIFIWAGHFCGPVFEIYGWKGVLKLFAIQPPGGFYSLACVAAIAGIIASEQRNRVQKTILYSYLPVLALANLYLFAIMQD